MGFNAAQWIWQNGEFVPWQNATVHVLSHGLHYGSSVFEGIRAYDTPRGSAIFRLREHIARLYDSARIYRMQLKYTPAQVEQACRDLIRNNRLFKGAYLRPIVYRGMSGFSLAPKPDAPIEIAIAAVEMGAYLGSESLEQGVDACVSSWQRIAPNTMPTLAKAGGNYLSSQLISMEAQRHGYAEGIAVGTDGMLSEGGGENLFLVRKGALYTPPVGAAILAGITRDSIITLARDIGLEVREQSLPREALYLADEAFFTGTACEVTPIRSIDGLAIGAGQRGPVTRQMQEAFFGLFNGRTRDVHGWLDRIEPEVETECAVHAAYA
ncbi:MAG: branched-chain amino acid transaminase [Xanthomonadales bacterium]|nr:branched-chain amino acid transaminase [Xanthomonadales bacterium]